MLQFQRKLFKKIKYHGQLFNELSEQPAKE